MSLRWKLFRFLSPQTLLDDTPPPDISLFPSLTPPSSAVLRRVCSVTERSHASDATHGLLAFALPRGVVHFFDLSSTPNFALVTPHTAVIPTKDVPQNYLFTAHDVHVVDVKWFATATRLALFTVGVDHTVSTLKIWQFRAIPATNTTNTPIVSATAPSSNASLNSNLLNTAPQPPAVSYALRCVAMYRLSADVKPTSLALQTAFTDANRSRDVEEPDLLRVAVGFEDGSVTLFSRDIFAERAVRVRVAPAPAEMVQSKPVVFLHFCNPFLYCVTELSVCLIEPLEDMEKVTYQRIVLDNSGIHTPALCCVMEHSQELVVAKKEALYFFNHDGRGPCLAFSTNVADKSSIVSVGTYIIHCTAPNVITAYDIANKLIAYRGKGTVLAAFTGLTDGACAAILHLAGASILKLTEIPLNDRVNMLLKRGLYVPAVAMASAHRGKHHADIRVRALRQYAEYLMSKDRYNEAAEQLVQTIGNGVEPSWVITRLVEQSGLRSGLRHYLERLHSRGKAAFVHTKVLITCYRHDRARAVILSAKATENTTDEYVINVFSDVDWSEEQVDAAISLCRDAGLFKVAERVSRRRGRYVQLALTLVEDMQAFEKTFELLKTLLDQDALNVIRAVGKSLLQHDPDRLVQYLSEALARSSSRNAAAEQPAFHLDAVLPMFLDKPAWRAVLLDRILKTPGGVSSADTPRVWLLLFESLVHVDMSEKLLQRKDSSSTSTYSPASGTDGSNGGKRIVTVASTTGSDTVSESSRSFGGGAERKERTIMGRRALKILQEPRSVIDRHAALSIASQCGHEPCLEFLYERLQMYRELGTFLRMCENGHSLLRACRRHGERETHLWIECIRLFAPWAAKEVSASREAGVDDGGNKDNDTTAAADEDDEDDVDGGSVTSDGRATSKMSRDTDTDTPNAHDVLDECIMALDRSGALSSVEIVDVVCKACPTGAWGLIRDYFERCISALRKDAIASEHGSLLLETELKELHKEAGSLEETVVIQPKTCASCEEPISVPAVHFFCEHSYHASCLAPGGVIGVSGVNTGERYAAVKPHTNAMWSDECARCAPDLDALVSMRQALQEKNGRHDEFFATVRASRDGFGSIVEMLERSAFI